MAQSGTEAGKATAHPLRTLVNHRQLISKLFPRFANAATTDSPSVTENQEIIHCAASQGIVLALSALPTGSGFSYDLPDRFGRTPLHWAAEQGHRNVVHALLRAGASVDPRSHLKNTPIMLAASRGHVEVVELLVNSRAGESDCWPLNRHRRGIGHWRSTSLHCAAASGHVRVVEVLLDAGFDREQRDGAGLTPAEISARQSHYTSPAITHLLLPSDMGGKLVHDYVDMTTEDVTMVSGLVKGGAFLDWQNEKGDTPLHRAAYFRHAVTSRVLLQAGADPDIRDHVGVSPLHVAACTGCGEMVANLINVGADLEARMAGDFSPLHVAVVTNRANIVSLLLHAGASMEHRDATHGQTPLSWASKGCLSPIIRALVEAGADVESRSSAGLTPLHWACRFNEAESVELLLNFGADPRAVDRAAANDAVTKSPRSSGMSVPMPVAADVIGLGYPLHPMENSRRPFTGGAVPLAVRQSDLASVNRIELYLHDAQQERSWRRRGWLVILANRRIGMVVRGVRDERTAVGFQGCCSACPQAGKQLRHVDTGVEQPPGAHQNGTPSFLADANMKSSSSDSRHPHGELSTREDAFSKRPRSVTCSVGVMTRAASRRKGLTRGDNESQTKAPISLSVLVGALLGLRAIEVGVFRRVVEFI